MEVGGSSEVEGAMRFAAAQQGARSADARQWERAATVVRERLREDQCRLRGRRACHQVEVRC